MPCVDDQVVSVRRALDLLDAFGIDDGHLTIAELARRTALPKTSALRLARTLQSSGYLVQEEGGAVAVRARFVDGSAWGEGGW